MSYAPFLAAAFVLWPVMGLLGGQGYAPLLGLAALPALALARPKLPPAPYAVLAVLFVGWAAFTETWSPASKGLISGSLTGGDFAVKAASLRIALVVLLGILAVAGALRIRQGGAQISTRVMLGGFAVQALLVTASAFFAGPVLVAIYGDDPFRVNEGVQNVGRNANAFALALPVLAAYLGARPGMMWKAAALALVLVSLVACQLVDSQAAVIGVVFMALAMALVWLFPRMGYRWLFGMLAAYVAVAPIALGVLLSSLEKAGVMLPGSFQSRAWSWHVVIGKITEAPFTGHGLAASSTWRETYADHPEWLARLPDFWAGFPVVPGHPHNMALQIWAETGAIGAVLAALSLVALAFRLPRPGDLRADVRFAIAGVAGVAASLFSFAYSALDAAFWASLVLVAVAIILLSKRERASL
ncbi:MAG: O-antigen ligase family protein [Hyphomonas sp.]|uniref:O-antigen ligase family protein n=1 Tax=Hyphomonas sp. TaxID=87 RepID=UPI003527B552